MRTQEQIVNKIKQWQKEDLVEFAEKVIDLYEYEPDSIENGFTAYGKKEDWE